MFLNCRISKQTVLVSIPKYSEMYAKLKMYFIFLQ